MPKLVNNARRVEPNEPSGDQVHRGVNAIADVLVERCSMAEALDVARNVGMPLLDLVDDETATGIIAATLRGRRRSWPHGPWGKLSLDEIDELAARAAAAWDQALSMTPNGQVPPLAEWERYDGDENVLRWVIPGDGQRYTRYTILCAPQKQPSRRRSSPSRGRCSLFVERPASFGISLGALSAPRFIDAVDGHEDADSRAVKWFESPEAAAAAAGRSAVGRHGPVVPNRASSLSRTRVSFDRHFDEIANRFPDFGECELHVDEAAGSDNGKGAERQFGYCEDGKPIRIAFAAKIEKLSEKNIDGLVAHEFGHALDFRYGKRDLEKMLKRRLPDGVERRADAIAEAVFGTTIKYDAKDVQCVSCRGEAPRPRRLGT